MRKILALTFAFILAASSAFAAVAIEKNGSPAGVATTINFEEDAAYSTNGSTFNIPMNLDLISAGVDDGGVTSVATGTTALPSGYSLAKVMVTSKTLTLADGVPGQVLTILGYSQTGTLSITASTKTGWLSMSMDADGEVVTLLYLDDTYGWIVAGYFGTTITGMNAE